MKALTGRIIASCICFAGVVLTSTARADAPADAWKVAKPALQRSAWVVVGLDVSAWRSTKTFQRLYPKLAALAPASTWLSSSKSVCAIDAIAQLQGVVYEIDRSGNGAMFVSTASLDQAAVTTCLKKVATSENSKLGVVQGPNSIVEYTIGSTHVMIAYRGGNELVFPLGVFAQSATSFGAFIGSTSVTPSSNLGRALSNVNTRASAWVVYNNSQELEPGLNLDYAYGSADVAAGGVSADARFAMDTADQAKRAADEGNTKLAEAKQAGQLPSEWLALAQSTRISYSGNELQARATITDNEAMLLLSLLAQNL